VHLGRSRQTQDSACTTSTGRRNPCRPCARCWLYGRVRVVSRHTADMTDSVARDPNRTWGRDGLE